MKISNREYIKNGRPTDEEFLDNCFEKMAYNGNETYLCPIYETNISKTHLLDTTHGSILLNFRDMLPIRDC
ncbi:MAG: hypothetical protein GY861_12745 [bacterium]|nr:hypothetical protein [bacterium]